jgi:hypothetical protein
MIRNKTKTFSVITFLGILLNLFFPALANAYSFGVPYGSLVIDSSQMLGMANELMQNTEGRYGFTENILRNADRKYSAPVAEITFDNTNPKPGEKVTAHALPEYFKNEAQNLYYTWYIIHTSGGTPQTATNSIKKGKAEAAKIMAQGDYDPDLDGQTYSNPTKDPDNDGWPSVDSNSYNSSKDQAPMGGSDGKGGLTSDSSNLDPSLSHYCAPKSQASNCNLYTAKNSFSSYYQFNGAQSDTYCSTCASASLSWGTLSANNQCCYLVTNPSDSGLIGYDPGTDYCPIAYDSSYESCFDYDTLKSTNQSAIEACLFTECSADYNTIHGSNNFESGQNNEDYSRCFKHDFGNSNSASGFRGYNGSNSTYGSDNSGLDYNVSCKHKWEDAANYTSGSGKFPTGEEEYWKTDPTDPDTDGDGFVDGADIIGLGQQDFTWTYQAGDRIGVVVEGTSMLPTDEKNAYYKIMWGYLDTCDSTKTGLMDNDECDSSDDYGYGFLATKAPGEEGDEKIKISLSYTPENPIADSSGDNKDNIGIDGAISGADKINVSASLDNTELDSNSIYYTWEIQKGILGDDTSWKKLDLAKNFTTGTVSSGIGLSSFSFTPKTEAMSGSGELVYFKITLIASRSSGMQSKRGRASVTIPVNKKGIQLKLYQVDTSGGKAVLGKEICNGYAYCPVVQNQLLAAKASGSSYTSSGSDFAWSINGESYPTPSNPSDLFDGWSDTTTFFGIVENPGNTLSITVNATPKDTLQPVTSTRYLSVISPSVSISTADSAASWANTYTVDDNSRKDSFFTMASENVFKASTNSDVSYSLFFSPDYLYEDPENTGVDWKINGTSINSLDFANNSLDISGVQTENDGKTLKFKTGSTEGASYAIQADAKKYWGTDEKNILATAWNLSPNTLESTASIDVSTVAASATAPDQTSLGNSGQILAAIGTHLPHYFMYLLRLVLTISVMFAISAGFYGLTQKISLGGDENQE